MPQVRIIRSKQLERSLVKSKRQYLVGNLTLPQALKHIPSKDTEIGISDYKDKEIENPHFHPKQTEFMLVLWGLTAYYDISNSKIYKFKKGDFYCIESGVKYAQKIFKKTRIFFIKTPAVNDKTLCELTPKVEKWLKDNK
jgi:8-oxo-dGTP diphosphatase